MMEQPPPQGDGTTSNSSSSISNDHPGVSPSSSAAAASASTTPSSSSAWKPPQHPPREREREQTTPSSTLELPEHFEPSDRDIIVGWARQNYHHGTCFVLALSLHSRCDRQTFGSIDRSMSVVAVVAVDFGFSSVIRHTLTYILSPSSHLLDSLSFDFFLLLGFGFGFFFLSVPLEYGTTAVL